MKKYSIYMCTTKVADIIVAPGEDPMKKYLSENRILFPKKNYKAVKTSRNFA